jgi:chorismate synthase
MGGTITCVIRNCPLGLGEPCFDKLEALLAHAMLSIPSTKAFEIGSGFRGTTFYGSQHNDPFVDGEGGRLRTATNWSGGVQGGISNGEDIYFRVGFKPPATISQEQPSARYDGTHGVLAAKGRHDPCVVPRAVPIVETMAALVLME